MRIWSLHPKYLDTKGLVALWRETILAKNVLAGLTKGYKNHPQLTRFKKAKYSLDCINEYLSIVHEDAIHRGFKFNRDKINWEFSSTTMMVTTGQLEYEMEHLLKKLFVRDKEKYEVLRKITCIDSHPIFKVVAGEIEYWEIIKS